MTATRIDCGVCVLRPFVATDSKVITPLLNDRDVWLNLSDRISHPYLLEHAEAFIAKAATHDPPHHLAITVDDIVVGGIGITPGTGISRVSAEIGYWLGKPHWGRGIGSEAVKAMTKYTLEHFEFTRVFALLFTNNSGSARVLEKAGYVREGHTRQSVIKDGVVQDEYLYAYYA